MTDNILTEINSEQELNSNNEEIAKTNLDAKGTSATAYWQLTLIKLQHNGVTYTL